MNSVRWSTGSGLNLERAEQLVELLGNVPLISSDESVIDLDLSKCRHVDVGAGWRVGSALRPHQRSNLRVDVPDPMTFAGRWFQDFTRSGLGFSISSYASRISAAGQDVTEKIRSYYASPRRPARYLSVNPATSWMNKNFCLIPRIHLGSLDPDDQLSFAATLKELYPVVSLRAGGGSEEFISQVERILFEAVQNCYDHAAKKPLSPEEVINSYFSLRYYERITTPKALTTHFVRYLDRLDAETHTPLRPSFVEIVVVDDGVGLASRHALDAGVRDDLARERQLFASTFEAGESVKLRARDAAVRGDPGFGFTLIARSLRALGAFALVRSGRCQATFSAFDEGLQPSVQAGLGYLPGTALQVIVPIHKPAQLPLHA